MTKETESKHTPTPWHLGPNGLDIRDAKEEWITSLSYTRTEQPSYTQDANAAFIIRAINSHDALLVACKGMRQELNRRNILIATMWDNAIAQAEGRE